MKKNREKQHGRQPKQGAVGSPDWRGPQDGPWPRARVGGELEAAEPEWLITNDVGTYAMSSLALMHTRRQHGLLVTNVGSDFKRFVVLSHLEMALETSGRTYQLSTHQFPNVAPTLGYRHLESFAQDPLPRWSYRLPKGMVERTVALVPGHRAVVLSLTWSGKKPARLMLRPLMPMRASDDLCVEHGGMLQKVVLRPNEVSVQPVRSLPEVTFRHEKGVFMGSPDWWRKFEYLDDRGRYVDFQDDMWSPGIFEIDLRPGETASLVVGVGELPDARPAELVLDEARRRLELDPGDERAPEVRALWVAAESFVLRDGEAIVAGYPWLDVWSRDSLLSLPGLFLTRHQVARAVRCLDRLLDHVKDGMLPRRVLGTDARWMPCLDSTLWLFSVGERVLRASSDEALERKLVSKLEEIFRRVQRCDGGVAWLTAGLLENGSDVPLTWMDAHDETGVYTPRQGLAVEIQALWVQACRVLARLSEASGALQLADEARKAQRDADREFRERFWCYESNYPFDCMSAHMDSAEAWADPSIRPNALIALAVAPELFDPWQREEILLQVEERLLTEHGVRTLEPGPPHYMGNAGGTIRERRAASHQGTVWPHLLYYYVVAALAEGRSRDLLLERVRQAIKSGRALGYIPQTADGDAPHKKRGSPAYAVATAMLLEVLVDHLDIRKQGRVLW